MLLGVKVCVAKSVCLPACMCDDTQCNYHVIPLLWVSSLLCNVNANRLSVCLHVYVCVLVQVVYCAAQCHGKKLPCLDVTVDKG